jgi:hypothetical protein
MTKWQAICQMGIDLPSSSKMSYTCGIESIFSSRQKPAYVSYRAKLQFSRFLSLNSHKIHFSIIHKTAFWYSMIQWKKNAIYVSLHISYALYCYICMSFALKKISKAITLLPCIGSNGGWDIDYCNRVLSWFSSAPAGEFRGSTLQHYMTASFHILSNSSLINQPTIRRY